MKTHFLKVLLPVFAFVALALSANAQVPDQLNVNVPYQFVVGGKIMPAGMYHLRRGSDSSVSQLVLTSFENHTGVLFIPSDWVDARTDAANLTFEQINGQHFLSKIATAEHVFTIPVSQSAVQETMRNVPAVSTTTAISKSN